MDIKLNTLLAQGYKSNSQIARVLTEGWVNQNSYCPSCGNDALNKFKNNTPVSDFICDKCNSEYELKSKNTTFTLKIVDGAYETMIRRINADNNPHFFFLNYTKNTFEVQNFLVIPKYYFIDDIIEKRKPLGKNARRAGWIGCNILLNSIPQLGKIFLIKNRNIENRKEVLEKWAKTSFLAKQNKEARGWTIEVLKIVDSIKDKSFKLQDMYAFEKILKEKFPNNNFVKDKIRQQLQVIRDKGLIKFKGNGLYQKI
ncbi:MAG: DpnI domain-containing protein [Smithella sp.]